MVNRMLPADGGPSGGVIGAKPARPAPVVTPVGGVVLGNKAPLAAPVNSGALIASAAAGGIAWGPARAVEAGRTVEVYPKVKNTDSVFVATGDPNSFLIAGVAMEIAPGQASVIYPVRNLADVMCKNKVANEGIYIRIRD